jgi:hypothetical protein
MGQFLLLALSQKIGHVPQSQEFWSILGLRDSSKISFEQPDRVQYWHKNIMMQASEKSYGRHTMYVMIIFSSRVVHV